MGVASEVRGAVDEAEGETEGEKDVEADVEAVSMTYSATVLISFDGMNGMRARKTDKS